MKDPYLEPARMILIEERNKILDSLWRRFFNKHRLDFIEHALDGLDQLEDIHFRLLEAKCPGELKANY